MAIISSSFSLEEECEAPLCTAALAAKNRELQNDTKKVTSVFEKLQNYINLLALPSRLTRNISAAFASKLCNVSQSFLHVHLNNCHKKRIKKKPRVL